MAKISVMLGFFFCLQAGFLLSEAEADIYKYTDKNGVMSFADDLQAIPEDCRGTAVLMEEPDQEPIRKPQAVLTEIEEGQVPEEIDQPPAEPRPLGTRLTISAAAAATAFAAFVILSRLPRIRENKKTLPLIRGSLAAIVFLFLMIAHVKDVMKILGMAGRTIEDVQHRSAERGKKAGKAMKQFNELVTDSQNQVNKLEESGNQ